MLTGTKTGMCRGWVVLCAAIAAHAFVHSGPARAQDPADRELIPESRRVLEYLREVQGKGIPTGISDVGGGGGPQNVLHRTGREPAIFYGNMAGYHPLEPERQHAVLRGVTDNCLAWWREKGGIVHLHYHWCWVRPGEPSTASYMRNPDPPDLEKMLTPGTDEHKAFHHYLSVSADYLAELDKARVPVLWAPFHEIDGGWFWWTDAAKPENTAALWRQMFRYLVHERKLHNLIRVYQPAHVAHAANEKGGRTHLCEAPEGPFRQMSPDPFFETKAVDGWIVGVVVSGRKDRGGLGATRPGPDSSDSSQTPPSRRLPARK